MRPRLLFIYLHESSFVREDLRILGEEYELVRYPFFGERDEGKPGPVELGVLFLRQLLWLLRELPRADGMYGWFADYHMLLPVVAARALRKPVAVAVGGFDAISLPTLGYGIVLSRWRWPLARAVLRLADILLPVSPSLVYSRNRFSEWPKVTEQGIRAFAPDVPAPIHVLPTGYDPEAWPMGPLERGNVVSTVGMIDSDRTLRRKGIDLLFETARALPDVPFRVVGVVDRDAVAARYHPPENVALVAPVRRDELVAHYHETSVYLQLSRAEGLPNVLCEAMLCGCVPVGSRAFGIPDGVGEAGWVVDEPDPKAIAAALRAALQAAPDQREAARAHVEQRFHIDLRREHLIEIIRRLLARGGPSGASPRSTRPAT